MPLYEYLCTACGRLTEKRQKFSDPEITDCPHCGGKLERTITAPAIQFKGGGWYADLYSKGKKPAAATGASGESGSGTESSPAAEAGKSGGDSGGSGGETSKSGSESKRSDSGSAKPAATPAASSPSSAPAPSTTSAKS